MRELLRELTTLLDQGRECVYCSLIETRGSTPQKAGAAMLVFPDGGQFGTLGGGCVEAEVKQRALRLLGGPELRPEVLTFSLDDNYGWDDGLICGGRMAILADPIRAGRQALLPAEVAGRQECLPTQSADYYRRFRELVESGRGCTEAIILSNGNPGVSVGSRYLFDADANLRGQTAAGAVPNDVVENLVSVQCRPQAAVRHGIAYLPILPRIMLLIVGAGHVGHAVARLAADLDFKVWVVDDRASYANQERFPTAEKIIVGDIGQRLLELVPGITPSTFAIIVTRGHAHDEEALYHLARSPAGYVGMIGSKRKIKLIYQDLVAKGISADDLRKVHAPLGFAIGSQTVGEIAVSIVAELIACRNLGHTIPSARMNVPI
jgi:xanthine dehydrogenase accessory factor